MEDTSELLPKLPDKGPLDVLSAALQTAIQSHKVATPVAQPSAAVPSGGGRWQLGSFVFWVDGVRNGAAYLSARLLGSNGSLYLGASL